MKKLNLMLIAISLIGIFSCKKKDKSDTAPSTNNTGPTVTYNIPPAGGNFYVVASNLHVYWTKDFQSFSEYSSAITQADKVFGKGDTLFIVNVTTNSISFGNVYNPSGFITVTCAEKPISVSCIKGKLVVFAQNGSNYYRGYCDFKAGQTSVTLNLLPAGTEFRKMNGLDYVVMGTAYVGGNGYVIFSKDGINWNVTGKSIGIFSNFFKDGATVYLSSNMYLESTTDTASYGSANWNSLPNVQNNSSDSAGSYNPQRIYKRGNSIHAPGYIQTGYGNYIYANNVSTDGGATFTTTRLGGIPLNFGGTNGNGFYFTRTHGLIFRGTTSPQLYLSTDLSNYSLISLPATFSSMGVNGMEGSFSEGVFFE